MLKQMSGGRLIFQFYSWNCLIFLLQIHWCISPKWMLLSLPQKSTTWYNFWWVFSD